MLEQLLRVQIEEYLLKAQQLNELLTLVLASQPAAPQPAPDSDNPPIDLSFLD